MSTFANGAIALLGISGCALLYTFVGYGVQIAIQAKVARAKSKPQKVVDSELPGVTVVLAVYNECARIEARIANLLESVYPAERLRILVVSDGSSDGTAAQIPDHPAVRILQRPQRAGKPACLNAGVAAAETELIVFADARQTFEPGAIRALAQCFCDPEVGAASGALEIASSGSNTGAGVDAYWRLEKWIRASESQVDSAIGCTGAIYAIRRSLYRPIPADTLLDDVVIPMQIALAGKRVLFSSSAVAWDPQSLEPEAEQRRKKRTLAGNFQMLFRYPGWLLPWKNRLWWRLIAHKYLRLAAPLFLASAFATNALLLRFPLFQIVFFAQCAVYLVAATSRFLPKAPLVSIPAGFVFLNLMTVRAFWHYLFSRDLQRWESTSPNTASILRPEC